MSTLTKAMSAVALMGALVLSSAALAQSLIPMPAAAVSKIPPPSFEATSWILVDHDSGWIISSKEPNLRVDPASISKLMTAYVVFDQIKKGALSLQTQVLISEKAWRTEGSRMFVEVDSRVSVDDLLKGLIVQSGNDAAVALAEHVAGSEEGFAEIMNQTAAKLGMVGSQYRNSTGLPNPEHYSTAYDIVILSRALIARFPEFYKLYSQEEFSYNKITQKNRNLLLYRDETVDGIKTGFTKAAGYCLVGSAQRQGARFIAAVMGTKNPKARASAVHGLLKHAFAAYDSVELYGAGEAATSAEVFFSDDAAVNLGSPAGLYVTVPKQLASQLKGTIALDGAAKAPVVMNQPMGKLNVTIGESTIATYPLVALDEVPSGGMWAKVVDTVRLWFY